MRKSKRAQHAYKSAADNMGFMKYWRHETCSTQYETLHVLLLLKVKSAHSMAFWGMIHTLDLYSTELCKLSLTRCPFSSSPQLTTTHQSRIERVQTMSSVGNSESGEDRRLQKTTVRS